MIWRVDKPNAASHWAVAIGNKVIEAENLNLDIRLKKKKEKNCKTALYGDARTGVRTLYHNQIFLHP